MLTLRVLIADDQQERAQEYARLALRRIAPSQAASRDFVQTEVAIALTVPEALQRLARARSDGAPFDVLVTDFFFDTDRRETAIDLLRQLPALSFGPEDLDVILVSREAEAALRLGQIEEAEREWCKDGGRGFTILFKDAEAHDEQLLAALYARLWERMEAVGRRVIPVDAQGFEGTGADEVLPSPFKTANAALRAKIDKVLRVVAPTRAPILITGETGTGKEVLTKAIHRYSGRVKRDLVALHLASLPEAMRSGELFGYEQGSFTGASVGRPGLIETAEGGTLFLDEVGELPPDAQVTLLRVLQEKEVQRLGSRLPKKVDFRLVCATNRRLQDEVRAGRFREDLYYRIANSPVHIPPLRDRPEDIRYYTERWWKQETDYPGRDEPWEESAMMWMVRQPWRGNVRQLQSFVDQVKAYAPAGQINRAALEIVLGSTDAILPGVFDLSPGTQRFYHMVFFPAADRAADRASSTMSDALRAFEDDVLKSHWFLFGDTGSKARKSINNAWEYHREKCVECATRWSCQPNAAESSDAIEAASGFSGGGGAK